MRKAFQPCSDVIGIYLALRLERIPLLSEELMLPSFPMVFTNDPLIHGAMTMDTTNTLKGNTSTVQGKENSPSYEKLYQYGECVT